MAKFLREKFSNRFRKLLKSVESRTKVFSLEWSFQDWKESMLSALSGILTNIVFWNKILVEFSCRNDRVKFIVTFFGGESSVRLVSTDNSFLLADEQDCTILSIRRGCSRYSGQTFQLAGLAATEPQKRIEFLMRWIRGLRAQRNRDTVSRGIRRYVDVYYLMNSPRRKEQVKKNCSILFGTVSRISRRIKQRR